MSLSLTGHSPSSLNISEFSSTINHIDAFYCTPHLCILNLFLCFSADIGNFTATRACLRPRSELGFHTEEFKPVEAPDNKSEPGATLHSTLLDLTIDLHACSSGKWSAWKSHEHWSTSLSPGISRYQEELAGFNWEFISVPVSPRSEQSMKRLSSCRRAYFYLEKYFLDECFSIWEYEPCSSKPITFESLFHIRHISVG